MITRLEIFEYKSPILRKYKFKIQILPKSDLELGKQISNFLSNLHFNFPPVQLNLFHISIYLSAGQQRAGRQFPRSSWSEPWI